MKVLITGAAGFIGMHLSLKLLKLGFEIVGIDNLNSYYDIELKLSRLEIIKSHKNNFQFFKIDLNDKDKIINLFKDSNFDVVVNLAAQAGVRYSLENPQSYIDSNISGFLNILEASRNNNISHLIFASSSSVYGINSNIPFNENNNSNHPISLYGASKKANEMMAHSYSHLYNIPSTGVRFFTVYGPWGRPDMAPIIFAKAILENKPIYLFNNGNMIRDFTYIDDIVDGITKLIKKKPVKNTSFDTKMNESSSSFAPYKILNIGRGRPVNINYFLELLEKKLNKIAIKIMFPNQPGDVQVTEADTSAIFDWVGFKSKTSIEIGVNKFLKWYIPYYYQSRKE